MENFRSVKSTVRTMKRATGWPTYLQVTFPAKSVLPVKTELRAQRRGDQQPEEKGPNSWRRLPQPQPLSGRSKQVERYLYPPERCRRSAWHPTAHLFVLNKTTRTFPVDARGAALWTSAGSSRAERLSLTRRPTPWSSPRGNEDFPLHPQTCA